MTSKFEKAGQELGKLLEEKNTAYGDAILNVEKILAVWFPEGVPKEKMRMLPLLVRCLDKLNRIAAGDPSYGGESPWLDTAGYALRAAIDEDTIRGKE